MPVSALVKAALDLECFVVAEGEAIFFSSGFGLPGLFKTSRSGLALQPDGVEGQSIFRTGFPAFNRSDQPEGRGFLVQRGRAELLQVGLAGHSPVARSWPGAGAVRGVLPIDTATGAA